MKTILIPLDGSPFGEHALPAALALARQGATRLELAHVHQIITPTLSPAAVPFFDPGIDTQIRDQEAAYLEDVAKKIADVWDGPISQAVLSSPVADALCKRAQEIDARLIVLSTHGRGGLARSWMGSIADRVIRQSKIPTLAIRPTADVPSLRREPAFDHILIPLDGSPMAEQAIPIAEQIIGARLARYDLVRVVEPASHGFVIDAADAVIDADVQEATWQQAMDYLDGVAAPLRARGHVVMTYAPIGHPASAILERASADEVGLIAMTTHGRGGVARMVMGSVADKVLRGTATPMLIYRPPAAPEGAYI